MKRKTIDRSGQSIIEAMLALSMLTVGLLGILTLLSQSFSLSRTTADEANATYLASEGIELAKSMIDHDVYFGAAGLGSGWGTYFGAGGNFELDYTTCSKLPEDSPCGSPKVFASDPLLYDPVTHLYSYDPPAADKPVKSIFTREIRVTVPNANEIDVQSIVKWTSGLTPENLILDDTFYNWHP